MPPEKSVALEPVHDPLACATCISGLEPDVLMCASCGRLMKANELRALSGEAQSAAAADHLAESRDLWVRASALLPPETLQSRSIQTRVAELEARIATTADPKSGSWRKMTSAITPLALLIWKFKALLLGLTKLSTLFSMFAFFGVYWALYGWAFALGLVLSIYVHEMGHVFALRGFGIPASPPMFIPGLGAFIRLRTLAISAVQDARVGLAGPVYGLGAALVSLGLYEATRLPVFSVVAHFGAIMNLLNLIPVWQLDGSRGFHSLTRQQRIITLVLALVLAFVFHQGMLVLIAIGATYRLFTKDSALTEDRTCLLQYSMLLIALPLVAANAPLK